jgi:hypothetical protein
MSFFIALAFGCRSSPEWKPRILVVIPRSGKSRAPAAWHPCKLTMILYNDTIEPMGKHEKTLSAIFGEPLRSNIKWRDIEALFKHLDAEVTEGSGARVRVALNGVRATFHRPHPKPETGKGALISVRRFLSEAGVKP